jgi:hypothetical protein
VAIFVEFVACYLWMAGSSFMTHTRKAAVGRKLALRLAPQVEAVLAALVCVGGRVDSADGGRSFLSRPAAWRVGVLAGQAPMQDSEPSSRTRRTTGPA